MVKATRTILRREVMKTWRRGRTSKRSRKMRVKRILSASKIRKVKLAWLGGKIIQAKHFKKLASKPGASSRMEIEKTKSGFFRRKNGNGSKARP